MGNVLPLKSIRSSQFDPKQRISEDSARLALAQLIEANGGQNFAEDLDPYESLRNFADIAKGFKVAGKVMQTGFSFAGIGDQIYMSSKMMSLKSKFESKMSDWEQKGVETQNFAKTTGIKINNMFKQTEAFYKSAKDIQQNASLAVSNAHAETNTAFGRANIDINKFDKAVSERETANSRKIGAKYWLDSAVYSKLPARVIQSATIAYTNANKDYATANQNALKAQTIAETSRGIYLSKLAVENSAIGELNSANKKLSDSAEDYTENKAELDKFNIAYQDKVKDFKKANAELADIIHEVRDEQLQCNKRMALYSAGGKSGAVFQAVGRGIEQYVAGETWRGTASIAVGGLIPFTENLMQEGTPYVGVISDSVDALSYGADTQQWGDAFHNLGDTVLGIGLMERNVQDIVDFYSALEQDDGEACIALSARSIGNSWDAGCKVTGTVASLACGAPHADKVIGMCGKIGSDVIKTPAILALTVKSMDDANVSPEGITGGAFLTLLGAFGGLFTKTLATIDGGSTDREWQRMIQAGIAENLEGEPVALEGKVPVLGKDMFGLGANIVYPKPMQVKELSPTSLSVENIFPHTYGAHMSLENVAINYYTGEQFRYPAIDWFANNKYSMGYVECGGEIKPCINGSITSPIDAESRNAFNNPCIKIENAWIQPFTLTGTSSEIHRCYPLYQKVGIWALNGCNTACTPVQALTKLKDHLRPVDFSDVNARAEDFVDVLDASAQDVTPDNR